MVPKTIHHIVGPKINPVIEHCLTSWQVIEASGFKIKIWNDKSIENFLNCKYPFMLEAFTNSRNHAEAADIARYLIVHSFGGHYIDWDIQLICCEKYIDICEKNPNGYLIVDPKNGTIASEAFSAKRNEPFLLSLSQDIVGLYNSNLRDGLGTPQYSGPYRMRDSLRMHANSSQNILPVKEVFAYDYSEIREMPEREITQPLIHYWLHSWI
jgi:mannosyltransferase OCH1-like enzyme